MRATHIHLRAAATRRPSLLWRTAPLLLAVALTATGCASGIPGADATRDPLPNPPAALELPPVQATPDYQLGEAYEPVAGVGVVARDRTAQPASGIYSICYINGFQTQPGELDRWPDETLLRDEAGNLRFDPDWPDEVLLDTSTARARDQIHAIVADWINECARDGFAAVEFDNLDSYTRSDGALTFDDNLALAEELVRSAHLAGLAAGQKNAAEDAAALRETAGFDFAVTEECSVFHECGSYAAVYGEHVIDIEYVDALPVPFAEMCAADDAPASMVLRDRDLSAPGSPSYAFETCAAR
ncbi:endo alpha-1,4 polygalactosaminidase [Leucobacter komagatae]|uniref:endo alpha-1,4 polygalactosaminidase n=1 Tax=Leucobacter komagatae TaxID=55969 RepID=UPI0005AC8384|nr:endo alpha-1,4 polygalactosaminidase [Leucobacter komagatae]